MAGSIAQAANAANSAAAPAGTATRTAGSAARTSIAQNFDAFLSLLTTQLQNQNPLEPMNSNEFTQQLVQFSSVEQQLKTNDTLASLLKSTRNANIANAASFVGATVTADGTATKLADGNAVWRLNAPRPVAANITISDANGNVLHTERKALTAGTQEFRWNGRTSTGGFAGDGTYTIKIDAVDANGQQTLVTSEISGVVDSVDISGDTPTLLIGQAKVPLDQVKSVRR